MHFTIRLNANLNGGVYCSNSIKLGVNSSIFFFLGGGWGVGSIIIWVKDYDEKV